VPEDINKQEEPVFGEAAPTSAEAAPTSADAAPTSADAGDSLPDAGLPNAGFPGAGLPADGLPDASNLAGLGVDIIEIGRLERAFQRVPTMRERLFTEAEIAYIEARARPIVHYTLFFAAKEAVLKALGTGFAGMGWTDVEVRHTKNGRPYPHLTGAAETEANRQGIVAIELSLSYTHQVGVASAVAIRKQDRPTVADVVDSKAELMRQFKELRSVLDEMQAELESDL